MIFLVLVKLIYCVDTLYMYTILNGENTESILFLSDEVVDDYDVSLDINYGSEKDVIKFEKNENRLEVIRKIVKTFGLKVYHLSSHSILIANYKEIKKDIDYSKINFQSKTNTNFDFELAIPDYYVKSVRVFVRTEKKILTNYLQKSVDDIITRIESFKETEGQYENDFSINQIYKEATEEKEEVTNIVKKYYKLLETGCENEATELEWDLEEKKDLKGKYNTQIMNSSE